MPGIFGRPSALPFFAKQKAIIIVPPFYRKTAPLRKGSFGGNGVPRSEFLNATAFTSNEVVYYRSRMVFATRADKNELWGFPAPLSELFPVTLRSTDSLREPACCREKGGKNLYNRFLHIII